MSHEQEQQKATKPKKKRETPPLPPQVFVAPDGREIVFTATKTSNVDKFDRDVLAYWHGHKEVRMRRGKKLAEKDVRLTSYDPEFPLGEKPLRPSVHSPICAKCELHLHGSKTPFTPYQGADDPLVTVIFDSVTRAEDVTGALGGAGSPLVIANIIERVSKETGVKLSDIRWVPLTRCCNWQVKPPNLNSSGNWCRYHVIDDLMRHPPALIMPVGSVALGRLSHKSNAQEWSGRLLTFRGWPDDWLTNPKYALPRPDPLRPGQLVTGHPVFGTIPDWRIPMVPVQTPRLIQMTQNPKVLADWEKHIINALTLAKNGIRALDYHKPWYRFTSDVAEIERVLQQLPLGLLLCYDTETTGLRPWATRWNNTRNDADIGNTEMACEDGRARIVSMMFRWDDPATGQPRSIGFPWDLRDDPTQACLEVEERLRRLRPLVWRVLCQSRLVGHNLTFDMLFTWATLQHGLVAGGWRDPVRNRRRDAAMCALADACAADTWHMAFAWKQQRGSLGLEALAYSWVPDLAGYEEDFTLLTNLHYEDMHPAAGKGGHYLRCPAGEEHKLEAYVMGDVEVAYQAHGRIRQKLENANTFDIPIADPERPGKLRWFTPNDRRWVYDQIMSPASRVLAKMMARGLYVDQKTSAYLSVQMPADIAALKHKICTDVDVRIGDYIAEMQRSPGGGPNWELDLENKTHLKTLLFEKMNQPVLRLTKAGRQLWGEDMQALRNKFYQITVEEKPELKEDTATLEHWFQMFLRPHAAVDKFTLNKLTVENEKLRPLREYRKVFKLYSTYVRPLKNIQTIGLDKKARKGDPHLCYDGCIHSSFLMTGTRGGRLSSREPNLQNLPRDGLVKEMFTSRFGRRGCLYQSDLSQIELRLLAALTGDPTMVKAYFDGIDLHSLTASRIFNTPYEHFTKSYMQWLQQHNRDKEAKELDQKRNISKQTNFLTGYGGGAFGLQNILSMKDIDKPLLECEAIIEAFFDSYPGVRQFLAYYKKFITEQAVAVSVFGRVRVFIEVDGDDREARAKALRAGCNHVIQSTASDMMLVALFTIEQLMREAGLESILVSTVHDSLVIDAVRAELPQIHDIAMLVLNNFPEVFKANFGDDYDTSWLTVPFTGDSELGRDYLHTKKITETDSSKVDWDKLLAEEQAVR